MADEKKPSARDVVRGPDEPFDHPPAVTLSAGELRAYLQMALNSNRSAERTLIAYFCNCWELGMEPDPWVLREYSRRVFGQALDRYTVGKRLLLVGPKHRPRMDVGQQAAIHLQVAALFKLLRDEYSYTDALGRTAKAFHIGEKQVEKIVTDQDPQLRDIVAQLTKDERQALLQILEGPEGTRK